MNEILKFFPDLTDIQIKQFEQLFDLYKDWNSKINVISRKDIDSLYNHHVLHSLAIAKFIKFVDGTEIIDVGSGGGFPGIPLAIIFPSSKFTLVDSIKKKTIVAADIANKIGLKNVKVKHARAEELKQKFDFVVSRAVMQLPKFVNFTKKLIKNKQINPLPNGILYLKGGNFNSELNELNTHIDLINITDYFDFSYFEEKYIVYLIP